MGEQLKSLRQIAEECGVRPQVLYYLRHTGRGPRGFKIGRELRFTAAEVHRWLMSLADADLRDADLRDPEPAREAAAAQ